jgi:hypothetical protein
MARREHQAGPAGDIWACMYACMYIYIYLCVYVCIYVNIYIYVFVDHVWNVHIVTIHFLRFMYTLSRMMMLSQTRVKGNADALRDSTGQMTTKREDCSRDPKIEKQVHAGTQQII